MSDAPFWNPLSSSYAALRRVLRFETTRLLVLIAVAIVTVLLTRLVATTTRELERREAAEWFARGGDSLARGDPAAAVVAFRRAAIKQRGEKTYVLALAQALMQTGSVDAAERALAAVRALHPEDPDINLALAAAAARRHDVTAAVRYYHNALYAPWGDSEGPRRVRLALINFLLDNGEDRRAISELIAATTDLPPTATAHTDIGGLFARAGDHRRALEQFRRALEIDAGNVHALSGAGRAAFELADYLRARRYLQQVRGDAEARTLAEVADLVLARDPLATRISAAERRRRVMANVAHARTRLEGCLGAREPAVAEALSAQLKALRVDRSIPRDADILETAVNVVYRITREAAQHCGTATALDRALIVIASRYGLDEP